MSVRTFKSSNFKVALNAFNKRLFSEPSCGGLGGKIPVSYIEEATKELIRWYIGIVKPGSEWIPTFHRVVNQVRHLPEKHFNLADVTDFTELLWTSAIPIGGTELCSIINAALREDDPKIIMHAVVFSCAIDKWKKFRHSGPRTLAAHLVHSGRINPKEYPRKLRKDEPGHGHWYAGQGVAHASWRGGGFRDEFKNFFTPRKRYRVPGVLGTTLDKELALQFLKRVSCGKGAGHSRILWCFKVDGRGVKSSIHRVRNATFVHNSSIHDKKFKPIEKEFLYAAYSTFEVEQVIWATPDPRTGKYKINDYHQVVVRAVHEDHNHSTDLPLAPWY